MTRFILNFWNAMPGNVCICYTKSWKVLKYKKDVNKIQ